ncbi:porin [Pseudoduganella umbonata]|uniref:Porin n=1 Tax=Pseudoduganella umbonata TaxID=864828 RepID=A0A4P8HM10_9BURK|nr:porin [Pseudoduganella umbonata]MBB3224959.1 putative porin [Pseudoduganella umbonata]QCP09235.1 porin [Pseudoduganella umbonata]
MKHAVTAALALACAASHAQTQVKVYGVMDAGLVAEYGSPGGNRTGVTGGVASGSRLGFKGTEDLGGGLSANFVLESGINIDTGTSGQGGVLFGRQAWVGLAGAFGSVSAGRQLSPYYKVLRDVADPFADGLAGQAMNIIAGYRRIDNSVVYGTPKLAGWSAEVAYGAGEVPGGLAVNGTRKRVFSGTLNYAAGALAVSLGHHRREDALLPDHIGNTLLAARYRVGAVTAHAALVRARGLGGETSRDALLGLAYAAGPHRVLFSAIRHDDGSAAHRDASQFGVGYLYALSRRSDIYTAYGHIDNDNGAAFRVGNATDDGNGNAAFNLGFRHAF